MRGSGAGVAAKWVDGYLDSVARLVDQEMERLLPDLPEPAARLAKSMRYSVFAGGKRLRPALFLAAAESLGRGSQGILPGACALEFVHTYSLIHDDLPSMDDDDFRRGRPTNHRMFDEGTAILAGDALLTLAFSVLPGCDVADGVKLELIRELSEAAGPKGMVGGQMADLAAQGREISSEVLRYIHEQKTGAMLNAAVRMGAICAGADAEQLRLLTEYSSAVGLAFQIVDDLLDVTGEAGEIGKATGADAARGKATYPGLYGVGASYEMVRGLTEAAIQKAQAVPRSDPEILVAIALRLGSRRR